MANEQNLRPAWKPGESGNPKGRPKNRVVNEWLPACFGRKRTRAMKGLRQEEIDAIEQHLLVATGAELATMAKWEGCPAYAKNLAMAILFDTKNGRTATIDRLRERQYGKPVQRVEVTGAGGQPLNPQPRTMTQQEARDFLAQLDKET